MLWPTLNRSIDWKRLSNDYSIIRRKLSATGTKLSADPGDSLFIRLKLFSLYLCFSLLLWCKCWGILCCYRAPESVSHSRFRLYYNLKQTFSARRIVLATLGAGGGGIPTMEFHRVHIVLTRFRAFHFTFYSAFLMWLYTCSSNHKQRRNSMEAWRRDILGVLNSFVACC